jgi:phage terminase large subunit-like protein
MVIDPLEYPNCYLGDQYAKDIVSGKIAASKFTIGACKRYLEDLTREDEFFFDIEYAEKYLRLVQKFEHVIGTWKTKNIVYQP